MFSTEILYDIGVIHEQLVYPFQNLHDNCIEEFVHIIFNYKKLPIHLEDSLLSQINAHIDNTLADNFDSQVNNLIEGVKNNTYDIEDVIKSWERNYKEEIFDYSERRCASDDELFALAYHKLVHSPVLETMLKLEHNYAKEVWERIKAWDKQGQILKDRQSEEMSKAIDNLNITTNEKSINHLVTKHFEESSLLEAKWSSELDSKKEAQRREYRERIMQILEDNQMLNSLSTPSNSPLSISTNVFGHHENVNQKYLDVPKYEESFTIHLGSQLKQMHNIRIISTNVMDFCSLNCFLESWSEPAPHSLQTALALYSNDLHGLVLMTDSHIDSYSKVLKDFTQICQSTTEFHFPYFEDQLQKIKDSIAINISIQDSHSTNSESSPNIKSKSKNLQSGDVFVTKHSNLSQVHVVFHIVSDDLSKEINSRHPVLLGLRNILKTACSSDVTSLTIPLLLQCDMTEEMTITWCLKRAELVFKCVKGFMIEMASWGGSELKNLHFLLPQGISNSVFQSLTSMLPNIFKLSNPLVLKSSSIQKN